MMEIIKLGISFKNLNIFILKGLRSWSGEIKSFLKKTENAGIKDILQIYLI